MDSNKTATAAAPDNCQLSIVNYQLILKQYWGYDDFRGIQREIIESIAAGHDTLGLMPTGGGKSITFQVPALAKEGVCIVITPLIALMKDQVHNLRRRGIRAAAIYSGMDHDRILSTLENAVFGAVKILYVSPERLSSSIFRTKLRHMQVCFITVDEAHCISQWGYDFRPTYLEIAEIRRELPNIPVLALTATATPTVVQDIQDKLTLPDATSTFNVFRMSFERRNLAYIVRQAADKYDELLHILNNVEGSAIVYVRSRRRTKEISDLLNEHLQRKSPDVQPSTFYHAGLDTIVKDERQKAWQADKVRVIVAEYDRLVREKNKFLLTVRSTLESELSILNQTIEGLPAGKPGGLLPGSRPCRTRWPEGLCRTALQRWRPAQAVEAHQRHFS